MSAWKVLLVWGLSIGAASTVTNILNGKYGSSHKELMAASAAAGRGNDVVTAVVTGVSWAVAWQLGSRVLGRVGLYTVPRARDVLDYYNVLKMKAALKTGDTSNADNNA